MPRRPNRPKRSSRSFQSNFPGPRARSWCCQPGGWSGSEGPFLTEAMLQGDSAQVSVAHSASHQGSAAADSRFTLLNLWHATQRVPRVVHFQNTNDHLYGGVHWPRALLGYRGNRFMQQELREFRLYVTTWRNVFRILFVGRQDESVCPQNDSTEGCSHVPELPTRAMRPALAFVYRGPGAAAFRQGRLVQDAIANDICSTRCLVEPGSRHGWRSAKWKRRGSSNECDSRGCG